jgi:phosphoglycolate phosphatase
MKNYRAVIFDLDGTLANTMPDLSTAMNEMLTLNSLPNRNIDQLLAAINHGAREFVRRSLPLEYQDNDTFIDARLSEYNESYSRCYADNTVLYDGVAEAVYHLKEQGMKLAVLSNKPDNYTKALISKLFRENTFDYVLGQSALPTKPDPTSAYFICGNLDTRPSETIFVGDSHVDMKTAINAKMLPAGVSWGYRNADFLIENGAQIILKSGLDLKNLADL